MKFIEFNVKNKKGGVISALLKADSISYVEASDVYDDSNLLYCEDGSTYNVDKELDVIFNCNEKFIWTSEAEESLVNVKKIDSIHKQNGNYFLSLKGVDFAVGITHNVYHKIYDIITVL